MPIRRFQPAKVRGKVIICALSAHALKNRGKAQPNLFFPPFCRLLGQCGIATSCIIDFKGLRHELQISEGVPTVLISLIHELYDELDEYDIPEDILKKANAVFNSHRTAGIIRDKRKANETLSRQGIRMPSLKMDEGKKIFSNARVGSAENAFVVEKFEEIDDGRYNAEFIDTRVPFEDSVYFTCVRLVCIGTRTLQIYVRARDVEENDPSVHNKDTPKNSELLEHLYRNLVAPRLEQLHALGNRIGRALGPGFYAHDVLVDNKSGHLYMCETGFKFYDSSYAKPMKNVVRGRNLQHTILDQETYAGYAGSVFLAYCAEMGFL